MSTTTRPNWSGRLHAVHDYCARSHPAGSPALDAFVVSAGPNVTYLTGFAGTAGLLVCARQTAWLITDGRYEAAVRQASAAGAMFPVTLERVERRYDLSLGALLDRLGVKQAGFEAAHVTVGTLRAWQAAVPHVEWQPADGIVEGQRLIKDAGEIATLRRAARALSGVAESLGDLVAAGRSERQIARRIDEALERAGFSQPAFPTIVASGPNSALPHARPGERSLVKGDLVVLDFGGVLDGYCVDLTRMAAIGPVDGRAAALFDAVQEAQAAAIAAVRPGIAGSEVDAAARRVLDSRGLGAAFVHSTGHGLGLEVHEAPRLARLESGATDVLAAGMVCTVEPGAYLEGFGGVRLEDDVLVVADGCDVLTTASSRLLVV